MLSTARYRYLLERVYLDTVNASDLVGKCRAQGSTIINVLEFKPFDAAFYNVGVPLPDKLPSDITGARARTLASAPSFDGEMLPLILEAFQRVQEQVEKVFENFTTMVDHDEWFPAILSPDLRGLIESWREWWIDASASSTGWPRKGTFGPKERACWLELCKLLLALIPQPAYKGKSAGNVVYAKLTGQKSPAPDLHLDDEAFIKVRKAYKWRVGGEADSLSELRSLLELISIVPVPRAKKIAILRKALSAPHQVLVDKAMGELTTGAAMTAIGGPMIHNGQLEGIIYAASWQAPLRDAQNTMLKNRARLGAIRRHQLREHILRDVLLRAAEDERELSPVLLVLKHIPLLFSVVGAAAVCLRQGESRQRALPVGLIWRESTGERQLMRFTPSLSEDRPLLAEIRQFARRLAVRNTFSERPVCFGRFDPETARLLAAFTDDRILMARAQTVCAFSKEVPLRMEEWVYLLFFLEEPHWSKGDGRDHLNLETSVLQLGIELEAALDFVFAHRSATEQTVLKLVYSNAAHSMKGPANLAMNFADLAADHLSRGSLDLARRSLAQAQVALKTLSYFFKRMVAMSTGQDSELRSRKLPDRKKPTSLEKLDARGIIEQHTALFRDAYPQIELEIASPSRPVSCLASDHLLRWLLWEMLENATRAARKLAESTGARQRVGLSILYRPRSVSIEVTNPAGPLTRSDCKILVKNAQAGQPNLSNTSGGSGMGLAYCLWMAHEMKGRFKIDVRQGRCLTTLTLHGEV